MITRGENPVNRIICIFVLYLLSSAALAGQIFDDFESPELRKDIWDIKVKGNAEFKIEDGILTLSSPEDAESGIILYYPVNLEDMDVTIEMKLDSSGVGNSIFIGFLAALLAPQTSTDINNNYQASFYFRPDNFLILSIR